MAGGDLFGSAVIGYVIAAGKGKKPLYFMGSGFTYYRGRAVVYASRNDADIAMKDIVIAAYRRPALRVERWER